MTSSVHWVLQFEDVSSRADVIGDALDTLADMFGMDPPTMSCFEIDERDDFEIQGDEIWRYDIYFTEEPSNDILNIFNNLTGYKRNKYSVEPLKDKDWVAESQKMLEAVEAGRFLIYGVHDKHLKDTAEITIELNAGQAFGTGQHATTHGCLMMIDRLSTETKPRSILDIGTGSGVLAMAAYKLWKCKIVASDIDATSIEVTHYNLEVNDIPARALGSDDTGIVALVADGLDDEAFALDGPYDLIFANILAGPLVELAADIASQMPVGGYLILAGLRHHQTQEVLTAYQQQGLQMLDQIESEGWPTLLLTR